MLNSSINLIVYGNPENNTHDIKIQIENKGIVCDKPVICVVTRVLNRFEIISMQKKKIVDNRQWVTINKATIFSPKASFHSIGIHKKFISCTVVQAINFFKSVWCHILIDESTMPTISNIKNQFKLISEPYIVQNLMKRNTAVFTKKPLKYIEKNEDASTCVFVSQ